MQTTDSANIFPRLFYDGMLRCFYLQKCEWYEGFGPFHNWLFLFPARYQLFFFERVVQLDKVDVTDQIVLDVTKMLVYIPNAKQNSLSVKNIGTILK